MPPARFDHEKLHAYQEALKFCVWAGPIIENLPTKVAARDQLDRASTSVVLNLAEGNGKRSHVDRCRYLDIARGSALECAACLDVLAARGQIVEEQANAGKRMLVGVVSLIAGLIGHFSKHAHLAEEQAPYGCAVENENE